MITFIANLRVPVGNAAAFEELMTHVADMSNANEPGVVYYAFAKSADEPDSYVVVEVYRDQAACTAHGETKWARDSIPQYLSLIEGMPRLVQYVSPGQEPVAVQFEDFA